MSEVTNYMLLILNLCILVCLYNYLYRNRKLVGFQLAMNITMVTAGMSAFVIGILGIVQFPFSFSLITMVSALAGLCIGALFGVLFDYQTALLGVVNGTMMGLMSPMVGAVLDRTFGFLLFIELLFVCSLALVAFSVRRM